MASFGAAGGAGAAGGVKGPPAPALLTVAGIPIAVAPQVNHQSTTRRAVVLCGCSFA